MKNGDPHSSDPTDGTTADSHLVPDDEPRVLVYIFRLPFDLPLNNRDSWTLELDGDLGESWDMEVFQFATEEMNRVSPVATNLRRPYASVMIWRPARDAPQPLVDMSAVEKVAAMVFGERTKHAASEIDSETFDTVAEVVTQAARADSDPADWPLVSIGFERSLRAVNELVAAIGSATGDVTYGPLAIEELDPIALVSSRPLRPVEIDPATGLDSEALAASLPKHGHLDPVPYLLHWNVGGHRPTAVLDEEQKRKVSEFIAAGRRAHPFLAYEQLARRARRARESGDYRAAAIMAAVSGELLLNLLLRAMLIEEGKADAIPPMFSDPRGGFMARLRRDYARRLGGAWDVDDHANAVGHWLSGTQQVRNRIVHSAYDPTAAEASEAIHGAVVLEEFVIERLVARRFNYPKTVLSVVGEAGLERRQLLSRRMRDLIVKELPHLEDFWRELTPRTGIGAQAE